MPALRLAYASPLPPEQTGIADYSAELVPALADELAGDGGSVTLYCGQPSKVEAGLRWRFAVHPYRELPARVARGEHDLVLYHLGNNPDFHAEIYGLLPSVPGVVVLHEPMLHHLVRGLTLSRGDAPAYVAALRRCHGAPGEAAGRAFVEHQRPFDIWQFPLFEEAVDASLGLIVHNRFTADRVAASRPALPVAQVPHHLSLRELDADPDARAAERAALRARLGIAADALVIGSFGFITPAKRLEVLLPAFARLRTEVPNAVLLLAGDASPYYDLAGLLAGERGAGVIQTAHLALPDFLRAMEIVDVAVNLRHPTGGETSGTLMRLLGLGKAVVVTDAGAFAEIPAPCAARVRVDAGEEETLFAILRRLASDPALRAELGANAARHMAAHHSLEGSAQGYAAFLRQTAAEVAAGRRQPTPSLPPLLPIPTDDLRTSLLANVAAELVDLGVDERDEDALRAVATLATEIGLG